MCSLKTSMTRPFDGRCSSVGRIGSIVTLSVTSYSASSRFEAVSSGPNTRKFLESALNFLRDVMKLNADFKNFRVFGPDETASNRLDALYEGTDKVTMAPILPTDEHLSSNGRVIE